MATCLTHKEYEKYHKLLEKKGAVFTAPIEFKPSSFNSERNILNKVAQFMVSLNKTKERHPNADLIFTNIDIRLSQDDKHAVGICTKYTGNKKIILEFFDPNAQIGKFSKTYVLISEIQKAIIEYAKIPTDIVLMNSKDLNTLGTGNCAAWTYWFYTFRHANSKMSTSMVAKKIKEWEPEDVRLHNKYIRESRK